MEKPKYTEEQLEEARRLFGIETPERLDEAVRNFREFFSILQERDEEDRMHGPQIDLLKGKQRSPMIE